MSKPPPRRRQNTTRRLSRSWKAYASAASAALIVTPDASATVMNTPPVGASLPGMPTKSVDIDMDSVADVKLRLDTVQGLYSTVPIPYSICMPTIGYGTSCYPVFPPANIFTFLQSRIASAEIPFGYANVPRSNNFASGSSLGNVIGVRRFRPTPSVGYTTTPLDSMGLTPGQPRTVAIKTSSGLNGWIQLQLSTASGVYSKLEILAGAYESQTGTGIHVGANAIPEPSSFALLGLLAAGAAGVSALKAHRRGEES